MTEKDEQINILEPAIDRFMELLPEMLEEHEGDWVIFTVDDEEPLGYWSSSEEALRNGYEKLGIEPLLLREVSKEYIEYGRYGKPIEITGPRLEEQTST